MKYYVLKNGDYYLGDINKKENKILNFTIDSEYKKLYFDFEKAEEDRKLIFIETGLNLEVKLLKEVLENE